jgi:N-methylhydantoinase B/oxoprolinase/acetone carboxylase alpha subunit
MLTDTFVGAEGDQRTDPPRGLFGGHNGISGSLIHNAGRPDEEIWPSKVTNVRCAPGAIIQIKIPSSAGYGDPFERDPQAVLDDVLDELVSLEDAERYYGVVIDPATMQVDAQGTAQLRSRRHA